jgi:hypothetical protein
MITIPTCELVNLLGTAIGFAAQDKEQHWFGVQLSWDGDALSAAGYDTLSGGRLTWVPYEGAESNAEDAGTDSPFWGAHGSEDPWRVFISVLAAKEIVKTFKLPAKHALTPVTIKVTMTGTSLIVERSRDTGHSQHLGMWPNDPDRAARFPDVAEIAQGSLASGLGKATDSVRFNPYRLAAFGALGDTLNLRFGFGSDPTAVTAGDRTKQTKLEFKEEDGKLVSTNALPDGNDFPVSVSIKADASTKAVYEKFNLNLEKCPTCKYAEYACICDH